MNLLSSGRSPSFSRHWNGVHGVGNPQESGATHAEQRATRREISHRAFFIWERNGRKENTQEADWLEAEAEFLRQRDTAPPDGDPDNLVRR